MKTLKQLWEEKKARVAAKVAAAGAALTAAPAFAGGGGTDFSTLVAAVDFDTVGTGVLGVAAALITVYITIKGVKLMMGFVRGG